MAFCFAFFRSSKSPKSPTPVPAKPVGLGLLLTDKPLVEPHIVFNTQNLIDILIFEATEIVTPIPTPSRAIAPLENSPPTPPAKVNCIFFSHYIPKIFSACPEHHHSPIVIPHHLYDEILQQLPMTKCTKHGTSGFLPYDYVRRLPEYTCLIHRRPVFKIVHAFDECILEFPTPAHPVGSSSQQLHEDFLMKKYCYQCYLKFSQDIDLYMFRGCFFCSPGCRGEASVTRYWYKKLMKALDRYLRGTEEGDMDDTIFTIDP